MIFKLIPRRPTARLFALAVAGTLLIFFLILYGKTTKTGSGGFKRNFIENAVRFVAAIPLSSNTYYPAGKDSHYVYLGNHADYRQMLRYDPEENRIQELYLNIDARLYPGGTTLRVEPLYFFLSDWRTNTFRWGYTAQLNPFGRINDSIPYFDLAVPLSPGSLVVRTEDKILRQNKLMKIPVRTNSISGNEPLLEKQVDGFFCTDGTLHYNTRHHLLLYVYAYRNQYIAFDTTLTLRFRGNTIDTNSVAKFELISLDGGNSVTHGAPPPIVNKSAATDGDLLFIHSSQQADNEATDLINRRSVIDVYHIDENRYVGSFYISFNNNLPLKKFQVYGESLFAIRGNTLLTYRIDKAAFAAAAPIQPQSQKSISLPLINKSQPR